MTLTSPPSVITSLDTMLRACASFPGGATTWYPSVEPSQTGVVFILAEESGEVTKFAVGAQGVLSGTLEIVMRADYAIGVIESLARSLAQELVAQDAPLPIRSVQTGLCSDPDPGDLAGGETRRRSSITISYGLNA
jgi:hypothetical protein